MATEATSVEFQKNIGEMQDTAEREPVIITRHGRPRLVLCSFQRYGEMWNAWKRERGELVDMTEHPAVEAARAKAKSEGSET